jgi:hypothetical protein
MAACETLEYAQGGQAQQPTPQAAPNRQSLMQALSGRYSEQG